MRILVTGAAGMIGRKLVKRLAKDGRVSGREITALALTDIVEPAPPAGFGREIRIAASDIAASGEAERLIAERPDLVFHTAGIVSGEAESDLEKGYRVNLDGSRLLFDAIRRESERAPYKPKVVFTSSIAVFGAPFPEKIDDDYHLTPLTSYGTQKAMVELMLADYTRRGFMDGIGIRLPTICIRPGKPNKAASGFFSNILREPLSAQEAVLPVSEDARAWHASPRAAIGFLLHAAALPPGALGARPNLTMPGLSATVGEQLAALERISPAAMRYIRRVPDRVIQRIVDGWPQSFDPARALSLGFRADSSFDEIIRYHIEDELGGSLPDRP
jgi:nucleoside-diphosphate-sugar epimerase